MRRVSHLADLHQKVRGSRLVADDVTMTEVALPTTPTVFIWPNVRVADSQYNASTGVITIARDCFFTSVANWTAHINTGQADIYADAEFFVGGSWVRGTNSGRREEIRTSDGDRTISFGFSGFFVAGTTLRFVLWSNSSGSHINSSTVNGSTFAAARLTYSTISGNPDL